MQESIWKRLLTHFSNNLTSYLLLFAVAFTLLISFRFPVYFRGDDTKYLTWANDNNNPFTSFLPSESIFFGMFRPINNLTWWFLYHLFGLNPLFYQIFITFMYAVSLIFFFKLVELLFSRQVAFLSVISYFGVFFYLGYIIFWFSDLTFVLEMFFMNLSLYCIIYALKLRGNPVWGVIFFILASLSKEPSILIVPCVTLIYVITQWRDFTVEKRRKSAGVLFILLLICLGEMLFTPFIRGRLGPSSTKGISYLTDRLTQRWSFYSSLLLSELGVSIWISSFYLSMKCLFGNDSNSIIKRFYSILVLSTVLSLILKPFPSIALIALYISFLPILAKRSRVSIAVLWSVVPLSGIMMSSFMTRTYLTEASFGFAILVGVAFHDIISNIYIALRELPRKLVWIAGTVSVVILCLVLVVFASRLRLKLNALELISASRQNLREMIDYVSTQFSNKPVTLLVINYGDMGILPKDDIHPLDDLTKARRKKAMTSADLRRLLRIAGQNNISVNGMRWFLRNREAEDGIVLVMNDYENEYLQGLDIERRLIHETERCGERKWLYYISK